MSEENNITLDSLEDFTGEEQQEQALEGLETKKVVTESLSEQSESEIKVLKGLEAVRLRPGMYIGDANVKGLHQLVYEVVDNSIDEALAGFCKNIDVTIGVDNSITVVDDGRGIPVAMHPTEHRPQCEVALTMLHAGGKFDKDVYKFSGGLHGVGVSCVNALSAWLVLTIERDGKKYRMRFSRGKTASELEELGPATGRGTTVQFLPDPDIFEVLSYDYNILAKRLRELAYLNAGIQITLTDIRGTEPHQEVFLFKGGVTEFVTYLNNGKMTPPDPSSVKKDGPAPGVIHFDGEVTNFRSDGTGDFLYDVAFQYNYGYAESIYSFVNDINTKDGGTHLQGFLMAMTTAINNYAKKMEEEDAQKKGGKTAVTALKAKREKDKDKDGKEKENVSMDDVRKGLSAVVSVKVENPLFESQTKTKLNNPEVAGLIRTGTTNAIKAYFEEHPAEARWIVAKVQRSAAARKAAMEAIKKVVGGKDSIAHLKGKLTDCSCKDPSLCELYIVEGDSAGGSAKDGRESSFQAILPIRGKLINAEKAPMERLLKNEEIRSLCTAIGTGANFGEGDDSQIDISKARYHRIVIMTDADVDGSHIRTLVLTFLFRHLRPLVEAGYVYVARPPLFKVTKGKKSEYVETEDDMSIKLTNFGMQNLSMRLPGAEAFPPEKVSMLIQTIRDCLRFCDVNLPRYGIHADEFLALRRENGTFPMYMVETRENGVLSTTYAWSKTDADQIVQAANLRQQAAISGAATPEEAEAPAEEPSVVLEDAEKAADAQYDEDGNLISAENETPSAITATNHWIYIPEAVALETLATRLAEDNISIYTLYENETAVMELVDSKSENVIVVNSLNDLCKAITDRGRRGLEIQRFKGLGEMDPEELWETTMNPETRWMIQITMEDAAAADETFSMLMGDDVVPRRRFIEDNADRVLNPDI